MKHLQTKKPKHYCRLCDGDCTDENWCEGCAEFICDGCAQVEKLQFEHDKEDHLKKPD